MSEIKGKRMSRRAFLGGTAVGGAGVWAGGILPRRIYTNDPHRPPQLYEYYVDNYWFESANMYESRVNPPLKGRQRADIAIIGGGFAGMSTAYNLARRLSGKRIVLLEGARCGYGASGRNVGMADLGMPGLDYVYEREGPEAARKYYDATRLGMDQIHSFVYQYGVDCELEHTGATALAAEESHFEYFVEGKERFDRMGIELELFETEAARRRIKSERFYGGLHDPNHAILNPAKLAQGMKRVIEELGVEVSERSKVMKMDPGSPVRIVTEFAEITADQVVIALNGYAPQLGLFDERIISISAYSAATEPLSPAQMESIGWADREGLFDTRMGFMALRLTADNRIVFGGESGQAFYENTPSSGNYQPDIDQLCRSLLVTFPQLEGVRFTHAWGGTLGITRDGMPSVGTLDDAENIFHAVAFNGEGVVMCQLAGQVVADLMTGEETPITKLAFVNKKMPYVGFEPIRSVAYSVLRRMIF